MLPVRARNARPANASAAAVAVVAVIALVVAATVIAVAAEATAAAATGVNVVIAATGVTKAVTANATKPAAPRPNQIFPKSANRTGATPVRFSLAQPRFRIAGLLLAPTLTSYLSIFNPSGRGFIVCLHEHDA